MYTKYRLMLNEIGENFNVARLPIHPNSVVRSTSVLSQTLGTASRFGGVNGKYHMTTFSCESLEYISHAKGPCLRCDDRIGQINCY
jgi:hypothetical protein